MTVRRLHDWTLDAQEAAAVQARLRAQRSLTWQDEPVRSIGGVDIGLSGEKARAAIVVLSYPDLGAVESATAEVALEFPYIPGLLAFREGPAFLAAWEKLANLPDVVMFDGQGIAHPRCVGIATHMGLWIDRPTIGVAKSRLYGRHREPGPEMGEFAGLYGEGRQLIGAVLRTKRNVKPLYVSPGHRMDVQHAVHFVMDCVRGYRLPEPTRWAHKVAGGEALPLARG